MILQGMGGAPGSSTDNIHSWPRDGMLNVGEAMMKQEGLVNQSPAWIRPIRMADLNWVNLSNIIV